MDKKAQKRTLRDRLIEKIHPGGLALDKVFSPEFKRVFKELTLTDDNIRSVLTGEKVGKGDPGPLGDRGHIKGYLVESQKEYNRREYLSSVAHLARFHAHLNYVKGIIDKLDLSFSDIHDKFLLKDVKPEYLQYLSDVKKKMSSYNKEMVKESGFLDLLHNITSVRGRGLAAWEKRHPKIVAPLKEQTSEMIDKSKELLKEILNLLSSMSKARSARKLDEYIESANEISRLISQYDSEFSNYYKSVVRPWVDKYDELQLKMEEMQKKQRLLDSERQKRHLEESHTVPDFNAPTRQNDTLRNEAPPTFHSTAPPTIYDSRQPTLPSDIDAPDTVVDEVEVLKSLQANDKLYNLLNICSNYANLADIIQKTGS